MALLGWEQAGGLIIRFAEPLIQASAAALKPVSTEFCLAAA